MYLASVATLESRRNEGWPHTQPYPVPKPAHAQTRAHTLVAEEEEEEEEEQEALREERECAQLLCTISSFLGAPKKNGYGVAGFQPLFPGLFSQTGRLL